MIDLYPDPGWNFVFGEALPSSEVGVFSFARYDPAFYGEDRGTGYEPLLLRRSLGVLAHEMAHLFGLAHCVYFQCLLNGSNHLAESDRRPLQLCPVCLRKLRQAVGFDVAARYRALSRFYREYGFVDEAAQAEARLEKMG
jgi:archaemetzincin